MCEGESPEITEALFAKTFGPVLNRFGLHINQKLGIEPDQYGMAAPLPGSNVAYEEPLDDCSINIAMNKGVQMVTIQYKGKIGWRDPQFVTTQIRRFTDGRITVQQTTVEPDWYMDQIEVEPVHVKWYGVDQVLDTIFSSQR